jgi:hypothetical protein
MNIKPPGSPFPELPPQGAPGDGVKSAGRFNAARLPVETEGAQTAEQAAAASLTSKYTKADLNNPAAVDAMVREVVAQMVERDSPLQAPASDAASRSVVDFMADDPVCRRQVETYLQQVLK